MAVRVITLAVGIALTFQSAALQAQTLPPPRVMPYANGSMQPPVHLAPTILPPTAAIVAVMPPAGRPLNVMPLAASPYPPPGYRPSAYQVWQNYGLTYQGWLRPRVIQVQDSGYFLYNGAPFPYVHVFPGHHFGSVAPAGPAVP
jgi:hypothetical protein